MIGSPEEDAVTERCAEQAEAVLDLYRHLLVERWGEGYAQHPLYQKAVERVVGGLPGRYAIEEVFALQDPASL